MPEAFGEEMSKFALELVKAISLLATAGVGWKLAVWIIALIMGVPAI
ncbi:MAG: hypothetical protein ACTSSP_07500 [Candidatus Asgardarchaeia archaeon]